MITITCLCGYTGAVPDKFGGQKVKCRECSAVIPVPAKDEEPPAEEREPEPAQAPAPVIELPPDPAPAPSFNFDDDTPPTEMKPKGAKAKAAKLKAAKPEADEDDDDDDPAPTRSSAYVWGMLGVLVGVIGLGGGLLFWLLGSSQGMLVIGWGHPVSQPTGGSQQEAAEAELCRVWLLKRDPAADINSIAFQGNVAKGVAEGVALTKKNNPSVMPTVAKLSADCFASTTKMYGVTYNLKGKYHEDMFYVSDNQVLGRIDAKVCSDELQAALKYMYSEAAKKPKEKK